MIKLAKIATPPRRGCHDHAVYEMARSSYRWRVRATCSMDGITIKVISIDEININA
jgi:hypothetical protein